MFEEKIVIPYFLADYEMKLSPYNLLELFMECSSRNTNQLGLSNKKMLDMGYTWMIYKLRLRIKRLPNVDEEVFLSTWVSDYDKLKAYREYALKDKDKDVLAKASSIWTVIDINKRRPVRMPKEVIDYYEINGQANFTEFTKFKNKLLGPGQKRKIYKADLDYNQHVNSVATMRFLVDSNKIPYNKLREIEIYYKSQIYFEDDIKIASQGEEEIYHQIIKDDDILVHGKSIWEI